MRLGNRGVILSRPIETLAHAVRARSPDRDPESGALGPSANWIFADRLKSGYPRAIVLTFEPFRSIHPTTDLTNTGGSLMKRTHRILNTRLQGARARSGWSVLTACSAATLIAAVGLTSLAFTTPAMAVEDPRKTKSAERGSFEMSDVTIRVATALEAGEITPSQAAEYIVSAQYSLRAEDVYEEFEADVIASYQAGEIAREDIRPKLGAFKKELGERMLVAFKTRVAAAIEAGELTREEAGEIYKKIYAVPSKDKVKSITREDYAQAASKMKTMVAAGEIAQEQMDERLIAMRKMIGNQRGEASRGSERKDYAKVKAELAEMVKAGKITQEQADRRIMGFRGSRANAREDYAKVKAGLAEMVEAGKITQEQSDQRLNRLRKSLADRGGENKNVDWEAISARVKAAVENGDMTREEAGEFMRKFKERMGADRGAERSSDGISSECMALRRRLGAAVANGDMTREEAMELWEAEGCER